MKELFLIVAASLLASLASASPNETQLAELTSYIDGVATYNVSVCSEDSVVKADIAFSIISEELTRAEVKLLVDGDGGFCAGGRKAIQFNVKELVKEKIVEKGIKSRSVLLNSLPNRIEILNL